MANKRLIKDLTNIAFYNDWDNTDARSAAARALEEIEYLQSQLDYQVECRASDEAWRSFKSGDMK